MRTETRRKVVQMPDRLWKLDDKATRETITMEELRKILEGERKGEAQWIGGRESNHSRHVLEMVWLIANGYER